MALIVISVDREKLPEHTDIQFENWIKYKVGQWSSISIESPLSDIDLEAVVREM